MPRAAVVVVVLAWPHPLQEAPSWYLYSPPVISLAGFCAAIVFDFVLLLLFLDLPLT